MIVRWMRAHARELGKFGVVGVAGIVVNLGVFNLLRLGPLSPTAEVGGETDRVLTAKILATLVSILFAWAAHRSWTFRGRSTRRPLGELLVFGLVNGVAIAAEAGVLAISHYVLDYTSLLADNVAAVIGIGLGTVLRYVGYTLVVFKPVVGPAESSELSADAS